MVKTKRTFARTALFASASLLLAARGADASPIGFTEGSANTDAFAADAAGTVALDCANLWFVVSTGALTDATTGAAGAAGGTHAQGYAVNEGTTVPPVDFGDCKVAPGYYMDTDVTSVTVGDNLVINPAPAGHYATGGIVFDAAGAGDTWDGSAALSGSATAGVTKCPYAGTTSAVGSSAITDCTPDCSTTNANSGAEVLAGTCVCSAGTYSSGTVGNGKPDDASNSDAAAAASGCTKCTATFSGATAAGITSARSSADKTACKTAAGYIITSAVNAADTAITVEKAAAGKYAAGGTALVTANAATKGTAAETASTCPAGKYSAAGASSCTACAAGKTSVAGSNICHDACAAAADSAGASTPIAVALATAAAVPLLL